MEDLLIEQIDKESIRFTVDGTRFTVSTFSLHKALQEFECQEFSVPFPGRTHVVARDVSHSEA